MAKNKQNRRTVVHGMKRMPKTKHKPKLQREEFAGDESMGASVRLRRGG